MSPFHWWSRIHGPPVYPWALKSVRPCLSWCWISWIFSVLNLSPIFRSWSCTILGPVPTGLVRGSLLVMLLSFTVEITRPSSSLSDISSYSSDIFLMFSISFISNFLLHITKLKSKCAMEALKKLHASIGKHMFYKTFNTELTGRAFH